MSHYDDRDYIKNLVQEVLDIIEDHPDETEEVRRALLCLEREALTLVDDLEDMRDDLHDLEKVQELGRKHELADQAAIRDLFRALDPDSIVFLLPETRQAVSEAFLEVGINPDLALDLGEG